METRRPLRIALAVAALVMAASALLFAQAPPPKRVALLVGVNTYDRRNFVDLKWAENDVDEMEQQLLRLAFDKVVTMKGSARGELRATRVNIEKQLKELLDGGSKNDMVLVMLNGHGQQLPVKRDDGRVIEDGFYCPVDAVLNEPSTMLSLSHLTDETLGRLGGQNLVLVDACREGAVDRNRGIQGRRVELPEGTAVVFACKAGERSLERDSLKHGVFTYAFLEVLRRFDGSSGPLTWITIVDQVQKIVPGHNPDQHPVHACTIPRLEFASKVRSRPSPDFPITSDRPAASSHRDLFNPVTDSIGMKLKLIPAGEFFMGAPDNETGAAADERPRHRVRITRPFSLGVHEVTQAQFRAVMSINPSELSAEGRCKGLVAGLDTSRHPVETVSWDDAVAFCNKLSTLEGLKPYYQFGAGTRSGGEGYRLPTEAEWEYACRAGSTTPFAFGERLSPAEANFDASFTYNGSEKGKLLKRTTPVDNHGPNAFGIHGMHGNVGEWCEDDYDRSFYARSLADDPLNATRSVLRVVRGGGWGQGPRDCRSATRRGQSADYRHNTLGFRVARSSTGS